MRFNKQKIALLGLITALVVAAGIAVVPRPKTAAAQGVYYTKSGTSAVGQIIPVFNATDSTIFDGELVNIDTTATGQRIFVKRYIPSAGARQRVLGLAVGNIKPGNQGGAGNCLIKGYHPRARMALSGVLGYAPIKISLLTTGSLAQGDTTAGNVGFLIKYVAGGAPFKAAVWFNGGGPMAGPAL